MDPETGPAAEPVVEDAEALAIDVTVVPSAESEVYVGGNDFCVRIKSAEPLEDIVTHAKDLYHACPPTHLIKQPIGFAGPQVEMRHQQTHSPGSMAYPIKDL